ncbi:MAG: nucleoside deaminase [Bacillota bacterium]|nr:nucleoside deaminase [Bacillota bacterium]
MSMNQYMELAIREAKKGIARNDGGPFGAVIVKNGVVIAKGHNRVVATHDPTAHGEIVAIRHAAKKLGTFDLSGCELYSTAEPCPMCLWAIYWANVDKVYYGCTVTDTERIGFRDKEFYELSKQTLQQKMTPIDRDECLKLFDLYNAQEIKTNY